MKSFHIHTSINKTFSLMVYLFWVLLPTDGKTIHAKPGTSVTLQCSNTSIDSLSQLTWKRNRVQNLFVFNPQFSTATFPEARSLSLNMSGSVSQLYKLIIERAQESHTGNYTCETTTRSGVWKQEWELLITAEDRKDAGKLSPLTMVVAITVPCVTVLSFTIALTCMLTVCRHRAQKCTCFSSEEEHEQTEEIYENCFDNRDYIRPLPSKPMT